MSRLASPRPKPQTPNPTLSPGHPKTHTHTRTRKDQKPIHVNYGLKGCISGMSYTSHPNTKHSGMSVSVSRLVESDCHLRHVVLGDDFNTQAGRDVKGEHHQHLSSI